MIVPQFWAEGRIQERHKGRQMTVRRFGWSDHSPAEAQAMADTRARQAMDTMLAGQNVLRREPKMPYNGADGVPIREEVLSRHGPMVVTRNIYGARCLNTPDALFVDIDFHDETPWQLTAAVFAVLAVSAFALRNRFDSLMFMIAAGMLALVFSRGLASRLFWLFRRVTASAEQVALRRVREFARTHPGWNFRIYRTPAGLRALATHATFDAGSDEAATCFKSLGADPTYARMCHHQRCFRARLSPKPWRIGIAAHIKPRPGVWPVAPERLPARQEWVRAYEKTAQGYAACHFIENCGSGVIHPEVAPVIELHDGLSQAMSKLPLA